MSTFRTAATALLLSGLAGGPALAATCNLTVLGTSVLDDEACTVSTGRGVTRIAVGTGGTILIRRQTMRVAFPADGTAGPRRHGRSTSYGQVITSGDSDDKTCYFNQRAVLCVEP